MNKDEYAQLSETISCCTRIFYRSHVINIYKSKKNVRLNIWIPLNHLEDETKQSGRTRSEVAVFRGAHITKPSWVGSIRFVLCGPWLLWGFLHVLVPVFIAWIRISLNAKSVDHFLILRRRPKLTLKDCSFQEYLGLSKLQSLAVTAFRSFMCSPESASWKQWFDVLLGSGLLCSDVVAFESATRWVLPVWSLRV